MVHVGKTASWVIAIAMIAAGIAGLMGWISAGPGLLIALAVAAVILSVVAVQSYRAVSR